MKCFSCGQIKEYVHTAWHDDEEVYLCHSCFVNLD